MTWQAVHSHVLFGTVTCTLMYNVEAFGLIATSEMAAHAPDSGVRPARSERRLRFWSTMYIYTTYILQCYSTVLVPVLYQSGTWHRYRYTHTRTESPTSMYTEVSSYGYSGCTHSTHRYPAC